MPAESYRWIDTNRRTDAEILSEIAGWEDALLVLYRAELLERDPVRHRLVPTVVPHLAPDFRQNIQRIAGLNLPKSHDTAALRAGLFQWHDALDESHECAQSIEGKGRHRAGDYWHAIMHRREPDYANSKYWFRRVGPHPIFPDLARRAEPVITALLPDWKDRLLRNDWDPFAFVDLCESVIEKQPPEREAATEAIQEIELLLLLGSTYQDATLE